MHSVCIHTYIHTCIYIYTTFVDRQWLAETLVQTTLQFLLLLQTTLQVRKEEDVYTAVISWLEYAPEERAEDMVKIMEKVRLPLVQWEFLMGKVSKHKLFTNNGQCWQYLQA